MASAIDILKNTFGVQSVTPFDPGVQKLAEIRSGEILPGQFVTITPESEAAQLLGLIPDPLKGIKIKGNEFLDTTLPTLLGVFSGLVGGIGAGIATKVATKATELQAPSTSSVPLQPTGGRIMSFADGDSSGFQLPTFGDINQLLQGGLGQGLLQLGTTAIQSAFTGTGTIQPASMAAVPMIARAGAVVGRSFFNRFPNLATAIQGYINRGIPVTRAKLWSLMKRFGPEFLISGSILTAAAVSELMVAGPGRRRMNAGNVKALRRAHRRMKAFHNVCRSNDMLLGGSRRRKATSSGQSFTKITQVK